MDLSNLKPAKGSVKKSKRVGRGQGSEKAVHPPGDIKEPNASGYSKKIGLKEADAASETPTERRFQEYLRVEYKAITSVPSRTLAEKKPWRRSISRSSGRQVLFQKTTL
jgi:large subunit ribosomal protein L15